MQSVPVVPDAPATVTGVRWIAGRMLLTAMTWAFGDPALATTSVMRPENRVEVPDAPWVAYTSMSRPMVRPGSEMRPSAESPHTRSTVAVDAWAMLAVISCLP